MLTLNPDEARAFMAASDEAVTRLGAHAVAESEAVISLLALYEERRTGDPARDRIIMAGFGHGFETWGRLRAQFSNLRFKA